ncbi:hypothetical protein D3C72_458720 [compost metagenome]
MSGFRAFTRDFFAALGSEMEERDDRLHVTLGVELAAHYRRETLVLTFKPHDTEGELVAFGSRAFEAMLDYLATRGRHAVGRLPETDGPTRTVRLANGTAAVELERPAPRAYYALNFHVTCLSDERTERLATFCLDADGRPAPQLEAWLADAGALTPGGAAGAIPEVVVRAAEDMAMAEAEQLADGLEAETLSRLRQAANRLVSYYEDQISEIPIRRRKGQSEDEAVEAALDERVQLRKELGRKLAEETARHQLRLQVRRVSQAIVEVPGMARWVRLETAHAARSVEVWENRHTGACEAPGCERCGTASAGSELVYGLCVQDHLVCPTCLGQCVSCAHDHCHAELNECHVCAGAACGACRADCASGHSVCRGHLGSCRCCGQAYCAECLGECPDCPPGERLAAAHGHPCRTCDRPLCGDHGVGCGLCGAAVCSHDRVGCAGCGDVVCRDHLGACAHCELPYCERCRDRGRSCRACGAVGDAAPAPEAWLSVLAQVPGAGRYDSWLGIENDSYRYLLGRGLLGDLLVVADAEGGLVQVKEIGLWRKLFGWTD